MSRARRAAERALGALARPLPPDALRRATVVIAPHPDDETLGCGATILRLRATGAPVTIVVVADGSASHPGVGPDHLAARREAEGTEAAARLGVDDVVFLRFRDGTLEGRGAEIAGAVAEVLRDRRPAQVLLPARHDPLPDHRAVAAGGLAAAAQAAPASAVYEYPIWLWHVWPWAPAPRRPVDLARTILRLARLARFRTTVAVDELAPAKRHALDAHLTQMARPDGDDAWPTLADVAGGAWLDRLLSGPERFRQVMRR